MVDYKSIANAAAKKTNHSKTTTATDFEYQVPAAGKAPARFIEYIELGVQPQRPKKINGATVEQKPAPMARFVFELLGKKNIHEQEVNGEKVKFADRISMEYKISMNEKATFKKLFDKMRQGRPIEHFGQMLNDAFIVNVVHNVVGEGDKAKTYANINKGSEFYIEGTKQEVPELDEDGQQTGEMKLIEVAVKPALSDIKIFVQDNPTLDTWASIEIKGTRKVKDKDGKETEVSKNWLQERILKAVNFSGSLLEELLISHGEVDDELVDNDAEEEVQEEVKEVAKPATSKKSAKTATTSTQEPTAQAVTTKSPSKKATAKAKVTDSLAALGIV